MSMAQNLAELQTRVFKACARAKRDPDDVSILAVTKTASDSQIAAAADLGLRAFGENRMQQARKRLAAYPAYDWHFIGSLQTNKLRYCRSFALIHSLDRQKLALAAQDCAARWNQRLAFLIQVNVSGEKSKQGMEPQELVAFGHFLRDECPLLDIKGLMTMAPFAPPEETRPVFRQLRLLRDTLAETLAWQLDTLSMGMSSDFEVAVEEGATLIRVGTALFGHPEGPSTDRKHDNGLRTVE